MSHFIITANRLNDGVVIYKTAIDGTTIELVELNNQPAKSSYQPKEGDIAIEARLRVTRDGVSYPATPVYVIRGNMPMSIKHYIPQT